MGFHKISEVICIHMWELCLGKVSSISQKNTALYIQIHLYCNPSFCLQAFDFTNSLPDTDPQY